MNEPAEYNLIACPSCGHGVARNAIQCPQCGHIFKDHHTYTLKKHVRSISTCISVLLIIVILILLNVFA